MGTVERRDVEIYPTNGRPDRFYNPVAIPAVVALLYGFYFVGFVGRLHLVRLMDGPISDARGYPIADASFSDAANVEAGAALLSGAPLVALIAAACVAVSATHAADFFRYYFRYYFVPLASGVISARHVGDEANNVGDPQEIAETNRGKPPAGGLPAPDPEPDRAAGRSVAIALAALAAAVAVVVFLSPLGEPPENPPGISLTTGGGDVLGGEVIAQADRTYIVRPESGFADKVADTVLVPEDGSEVVLKPAGEDR